jgi:hypothetical protein
MLLFVLLSLSHFSGYTQWSSSGDTANDISRSGNVTIGSSATGAAKLDIVAQGNGANILKLSSERPWVFQQQGIGAASQLVLRDLSGDKYFKIQDYNGSDAFSIYSSSGDAVFKGRLGIGISDPGPGLIQNKFFVAGNESGTQSSTKPVAKFINTGSPFSKLVIGSDNSHFDGVVSLDNSSSLSNAKLRFYIGNGILNTSGHNNDQIVLAGSGNIGFGTDTPLEKLHIAGSGRLNIRVGEWASFGETYSGLATIIGTNVKASNAAVHKMEFIADSNGDGAKAIKMQYNEGISFHTYLGPVTGGQEFTGYERMRIDNSGNVSIGTTDPKGFKLAVNGKIWSKEVNVAMTNPGPDYVFEKDYNLLPLSELETYITQNKHLPEVPSAKEMEADGLNLKEMNLLLLKKVEELTLHLIEQNNKMIEHENRFQVLSDKVKEQKIEIDSLKRKIQ